MTYRLAANAGQEEAVKHAYAMYVAIEVMRQRVKSYGQDLQTVQTRSSVHATSLSEHESVSTHLGISFVTLDPSHFSMFSLNKPWTDA